MDGICDDIDECVGELDDCGICNGPGAIYDCGCSDIPPAIATATATSSTPLASAVVLRGRRRCGRHDMTTVLVSLTWHRNDPGAIYDCGCSDIPPAIRRLRHP